MKSVAIGVLVAMATLLLSTAAFPNHLKAVVVDSEPVPVVLKEVIPVVSAKADVNNGGVQAGADSSLVSAGASVNVGAPSGGAGTQTGKPTKPHTQQPGLFDGIFNIPISVLQAVNTYLNNRGPVTKPVYRRRGHQPQPQQPQAVDKADVQPQGQEQPADVAAAPGDTVQKPAVVVQKRVNYDDIFNIPISVLKSVNQLLNG